MAIPFIHVQARGTYRDLGRAVGEAAREQVRASVDFFAGGFETMTGGRLTFAAAEEQARAYATSAERWLPQYVDELRGLAEGSGVPVTKLMVLNCAEEFTATEAVGGDHCTAVAVVAHGRHVVGHNMDWYVIDAENNVLFDLTVPDGTRVMGIAGAPYLLMLGMNSRGVANVSNSVSSADNRVGVPNAFVRRWSIEAPTLEEARARGLLGARARGTNHFLVDLESRLWDVETSATAYAFIDRSDDGVMAHTNHYTSPLMAPFEGARGEESCTRLETAERLLAEGVSHGDDPIAIVSRVLRSHEPAPAHAICGHPDQSLAVTEQGMTVGSMVCDLDERVLYACAGPPCENQYQTFAL